MKRFPMEEIKGKLDTAFLRCPIFLMPNWADLSSPGLSIYKPLPVIGSQSQRFIQGAIAIQIVLNGNKHRVGPAVGLVKAADGQLPQGLELIKKISCFGQPHLLVFSITTLLSHIIQCLCIPGVGMAGKAIAADDKFKQSPGSILVL